MLVKTFGSAVYGVEAISITVEVSVNNRAKIILLWAYPIAPLKKVCKGWRVP